LRIRPEAAATPQPPSGEYLCALRDKHLAEALKARSRSTKGAPMTAATGHQPLTGHDQEHSDTCGHASVRHCEHVDYLHGDHRHAA
jgi:hypothetical protein